MTLPRELGGRGLIDIQNLHNKQITNLRNFFFEKATLSDIHYAIVQSDTKLTPLNLQNNNPQPNEIITDINQKLAAWKQKSLHGRHLNELLKEHVDKKASNIWLQKGQLFPETEAFMLAIQDQVVNTLNYQKYITNTLGANNDTCRRCQNGSETIQHITGSCKAIAQTDYKHRHDQVGAIIHQYLAYKYKLIKNKTPYYKYKPEAVLENKEYRLYWDRTIMTDKTIHYNRPDITIFAKNDKTVYFIDVSICNTHNLQLNFTEKISKYTELSIEVQTQWGVKTVKTIPITISTTGVIPKNLHSSLRYLNIPPGIYIQLQKAVILNTCRIVRKFLSGSFN